MTESTDKGKAKSDKMQACVPAIVGDAALFEQSKAGSPPGQSLSIKTSYFLPHICANSKFQCFSFGMEGRRNRCRSQGHVLDREQSNDGSGQRDFEWVFLCEPQLPAVKLKKIKRLHSISSKYVANRRSSLFFRPLFDRFERFYFPFPLFLHLKAEDSDKGGGGRTIKASEEEPRFLVVNDKTGKETCVKKSDARKNHRMELTTLLLFFRTAVRSQRRS